jgi:site-specific DNA-methyltransferase (adenine-specific)
MIKYTSSLLRLNEPVSLSVITNSVINQDLTKALPFLPSGIVDLLILDPPYNLSKNFNGNIIHAQEATEYQSWFEKMICAMLRLLKPNATIYVCSDWQTSTLIYPVLNSHLNVRNRITWEREKGRGAKTNWKNNTEDVWFCTVGNDYYFDVDAVKLKRKVIAPYREATGEPKDWEATEDGNYRLTHPSNIWTDLTIPFWSMPENTDHPTQKPEKLVAKLILASSPPGSFVFDPFLGSGTTAVVAKKLGRYFCGVEMNLEYCCWAAKRLKLAESDPTIQGYSQGLFWERNSLNEQGNKKASQSEKPERTLFDIF